MKALGTTTAVSYARVSSKDQEGVHNAGYTQANAVKLPFRWRFRRRVPRGRAGRNYPL